MTLALEIEFLAGVAFAAMGPESDVPDWPPQPDRVFSALVATWGARGEREPEAEALRWLESQPVPVIVASEAEPRTAPLAYVPPNDPQTGRSGNRTVLPGYRRRQPRRFPASRPHHSVVLYQWESIAPDPAVFEALSDLAADTAYVGHSSSLTRCRFSRGEAVRAANFQMPARRIYKGRFDELRRDYDRFVRSGGKVGRPRPGDPIIAQHRLAAAGTQSCFSPEWLILEHANPETDGEMPDIRAAALVAKEVRNTLLSGYSQSGSEDSIPEEVSGHRQDGSPSPRPHLAVVPLAFAGSPYADGHVLGFALIPPRGSVILEDPDFLRAMRSVMFRNEEERHMLRLRSFNLQLSPTRKSAKASLDPHRYTRRSLTWGTVTPVALDRHLKQTGSGRQQEIADQIRTACENAGLPAPRQIIPDKHPAVEGVPSAYPSGKAPAWMRWKLPASLASRQLTHAVIRFDRPVDGPVIVGAGRFAGFGLCLPLDEEETV